MKIIYVLRHFTWLSGLMPSVHHPTTGKYHAQSDKLMTGNKL